MQERLWVLTVWIEFLKSEDGRNDAVFNRENCFHNPRNTTCYDFVSILKLFARNQSDEIQNLPGSQCPMLVLIYIGINMKAVQ